MFHFHWFKAFVVQFQTEFNAGRKIFKAFPLVVSFKAVASAMIFDSLILFILETLTDECSLEKVGEA